MSFRWRLLLPLAIGIAFAATLQLATTSFFLRRAFSQLKTPDTEAAAWLARVQGAQIFYGALGALLTLTLASWLVERQLVRPLKRLQDDVERWTSGDLAVADSAHGEVQNLAHRITLLTRRVQEDARTLAEQAETLDSKNAALQRAEQLALIGQMAAGLAHEVGNPLGALIGYVSILRRETDATLKADILDRTERELERIHRLLRELLDYARPVPLKLAPTALSTIIAASIDLVHHQQRGAQIEFSVSPTTARVLAEPERLKQVLVNLLLNAADAMKGTGAVSIGIEETNTYVDIAVQDHGGGFSQNTLAHAGEPFFTTKPPGQGTGLGLAVCMSLAREQKGKLAIENRDDGAMVTLSLRRVH